MTPIPVIGKKHGIRLAVKVGAGIVAGLVLVVCLMFFTPIMGLKDVSVETGDLTPAEDVRTFVLERHGGRPLPRISMNSVSGDIRAAFTKSEDVRVRWSGINTLHVSITDKKPVATHKTDAGWVRYSSRGEEIDVVKQDPELVNIRGGSPRAIEQALIVVQHVPDLSRVESVEAQTEDTITLVVSHKESTRQIRVGDASNIEKKLTVAFKLLDHSKEYVDVSTPDTPVAR